VSGVLILAILVAGVWWVRQVQGFKPRLAISLIMLVLIAMVAGGS